MLYLQDFVVIKEPFGARYDQRREQRIHVQSIESADDSKVCTISQGKDPVKSNELSLNLITPHTVLKQMRYDELTKDDYDQFFN